MSNDNFYCEKRKFIRLELNARGHVTFEDGTHYEGPIRDISIGGAFLETDQIAAHRLNEIATASISTDLDQVTRTIEGMCKVARVTEDGVGLFFHAMDKDCKMYFADIIRQIRSNTGG